MIAEIRDSGLQLIIYIIIFIIDVTEASRALIDQMEIEAGSGGAQTGFEPR